MTDDRTSQHRAAYRIRIEGILDPQWSDWFDGFTITPQPNGETLLVGHVSDQADLHGILTKIHDLNLPLHLVQRIRENSQEER